MIMGDYGKLREVTEKYGKLREVMGDYGRLREITGDYGRLPARHQRRVEAGSHQELGKVRNSRCW